MRFIFANGRPIDPPTKVQLTSSAVDKRISHRKSVALSVGARLGQYEILSTLGAGAMGEV
jgi:hypothetical protein